MAFDLVIEVPNKPGALLMVATAIGDAGVNVAAATCIGQATTTELHILVAPAPTATNDLPHPRVEAAKHALRINDLAVSSEREVVVVQAQDRPGELADLARKVAEAGVDLDLLYVATGSRVVFGAEDVGALKAALGQS